MIKQISVNSFKAISNPTFVPLSEFNVVIGRNSSGKSSFFEALEWLSHCVSAGASQATKQFRRINDILYADRQTFDIELHFDPRDLSAGNEVEYLISVNNNKGKPEIIRECLSYIYGSEISERIKTVDGVREYSLSLKEEISKKDRELIRKRAKGDGISKPLESILYALDILESQQFSASNNPDETILKLIDPKIDRGGMLLKDVLDRAVFLSLNPISIADFSDIVPVAVDKRLLDKQGINVARLISQLDQESQDILLEKISHITKRTSGCEVHEPGGPADRRFFEFTEEIGGVIKRIPGWVLSEGTRRITAILALLMHQTPPPLLFIEEIENGLDPWTIKFLLEELSAASVSGIQIVITTHSPYLLNHVPLESIILVDREKDSVVVTPGNEIPNLNKINEYMGVGDMYTGRYLHDISKEEKQQ